MYKMLKYILLSLLVLLLSACVKESETKDEKLYRVYYLNASATAIVPVDYAASGTEDDALIRELLEAMNTVPADKEVMAALEDKVTFMNYTRKDNVLYLHFDTNYAGMKPTREILARAALVKTLSQVEGIDFIGINSGDQPLADANGNPLPIFYAAEFIDAVSDVNSFEKVELNLYFANAAGDKLSVEKRELVHDINNSREKLVLEELIKGPLDAGRQALLPSTLKINNVSINDNTCYIDFDESLVLALGKPNNKLLVYSVVNSIVDVGNVSKVQMTINGSNAYQFANGIDLGTSFDRDLDCVEESY